MNSISHSQRNAVPAKAGLRKPCPPDDLPFVLNRERARADRTHSEFCVVLFGLRGSHEADGAIAGLAEVVAARARETDEVAGVSGSFVCAVLPDTPTTGARRFAEDVRASLNGQAERVSFEVLSYPSARHDADPAAGAGELRHSLIGAGGDGDGRRHGKRHPTAIEVDALNTLGLDGRNQGGPLLSAFLRHIMSSASSVRPGTNGASAEAVGSLDVVFAAPLPVWKRSMDVAAAGVALLVLSPFLVVIAAAVLLTSGRPVIFRQRRAGLLGRPFEILKFRTMVVDAEKRQAELRHRSEQDGPAFKLTNDPRVTRLGRFLRKTSLDELPQLWNVLKGDMSLVGPRPLPCAEASACSQWQRRRMDVTPGITCIWQVKGRSRVSFPEWMRMDISYIRTRRLLRDVSLLLMTVPAVLLRRGAR